MDGNDIAAAFILDTSWDALPASVQRRAKMCLLDDLASVLSGTLTRISRITAGYAAERMPGDEATILLHGKRSTAPGAALANAYAGNALDIDDDIRYAQGHPGAQVFPAALAVAEKTGASGRALLEAMVVGYEIASRTARCWHDHHDVYQACGSWGSVACAAVAGRLMNLRHDTLKHALGIAEYHAPNLPMMRDIDQPAMVKHGIGWGAMNGVISAELAERGFTGIPSILGFEQYRDWVATLGSEYIMEEGVGIKRWCSCGWGHAAFVAALKVVEENDIRIEEIAHIKVRTFHEGWRLVQRHPQTTEEAQFSIKWPLATLLIDGEVGPNQILEHRLDDEGVKALADKIEVVEDPEIERMNRLATTGAPDPDAHFAGRVEITLADGRRLDSGVVTRGHHEWDEALLEEKFRWITAYVLDDQTIDQLVQMVWGFENVANVTELTRLVQQRGEQ